MLVQNSFDFLRGFHEYEQTIKLLGGFETTMALWEVTMAAAARGEATVEDGAIVLATAHSPSEQREELGAKVRAILDEMEGRVRQVLSEQETEREGLELEGSYAAGDVERVLKALNAVLFDELGFRGNSGAYFDIENSLIDRVLENRTGNPVTLSVVYMAVARRLGVPLAGVNNPGHFLVRYTDPLSPEKDFVIDVFAQGVILARAETEWDIARQQLEGENDVDVMRRALMQQPSIADSLIWLRMLNNLAGLAQSQKNAASIQFYQQQLIPLVDTVGKVN